MGGIILAVLSLNVYAVDENGHYTENDYLRMAAYAKGQGSAEAAVYMGKHFKSVLEASEWCGNNMELDERYIPLATSVCIQKLGFGAIAVKKDIPEQGLYYLTKEQLRNKYLKMITYTINGRNECGKTIDIVAYDTGKKYADNKDVLNDITQNTIEIQRWNNGFKLINTLQNNNARYMYFPDIDNCKKTLQTLAEK